MKKLTLILVMASLVFALNSCGEDEEIFVDKIAAALNTSKPSYEAASNGTWVAITAAEYSALPAALSDVSRVGTSDSEYSSIIGNSNNFEWTIANSNGHDMPANSYLFAFKHESATDNVTGLKVKQSAVANDSAFVQIGTSLPTHNAGENYFVLKGNSNMVASVGYIAVTKPINVLMKIVGTGSGGTYYFGSGDVDNLGDGFIGTLKYQGLSTTSKQW